MKKKNLLLTALLVVVISVSALLFTACQSFKWGPVAGGQSSADSVSNGGFAVKQGDWLYFVNGYVGFPENPDIRYNYFGKAEKGSIMRSSINADGSLGTPSVVVPKNIMTSYTEGGFWIFGEWIYYASPTTGVNNNKELQTNYLDYMRTKIDGTGTQLIATLNGQSLQHKFTDAGMFYYESNKISFIKYDAQKVGSTVTIAESVTSVLFPKNTNYSAAAADVVADYVFYTKAGEDTTLPGNDLWVAGKSGESKRIYEQKDKLADGEDAQANRSKLETLTLRQYRVTSDGIEIYYEKSRYIGGTSTVEGIYGKKFTSTAFDFKNSAETRFTIESQTAFTPISLEDGILITGTSARLARPMTDANPNYDTTSYTGLGTITMLDVREATIDGVTTRFMFYISNNLFTCAPLYPVSNLNAKILSEENISSSFLVADIVGDYLYIIATDKLTYTARISINGGEAELIGKMTETDQKTWDEQQKEKANS